MRSERVFGPARFSKEGVLGFIELSMFGFNVQTVGFCGTLLFTTLAFFAQLAQCRTLYARPERRAASLAGSFYVYCLGAYATAGVYGLASGRLALVYNGGMLASVYAPIVYGIWKQRGFRRIEWALFCVGIALVVAMAFTTTRSLQNVVFGASFVGFVAVSVSVPLELYRRKDPGVVRVEPFIISTVSTAFWIVYAFATADPVLRIACPTLFSIMLTSLFLWVRYGGELCTAFRRGA